MMSRSLVRRLERLEVRLGVHRKRYLRVEYYARTPDGTLSRLPDFVDDRTEAQRTLRVVFVSPTGNQSVESADGNLV